PPPAIQSRTGQNPVHALLYGGTVHSDEIASHGRQHSLSLTLPPLATIWLVREAE
ncbi:hypothetical protein ACUOCP_56290, partial [Escherichia sp. R-CC3]